MIQTWLPLPSYSESARILSDAHLDLQRYHVLELLEFYHQPEESQLPFEYESRDISEHPIVEMWKGYELQLCEFGLEICEEWSRRFNRKDPFYDKISVHLEWAATEDAYMHKPNWFGDVDFHLSHQAGLLKLDETYYSHHFVNDQHRNLIWPESDYRGS